MTRCWRMCSGILLTVFGVAFTPTILRWMGTDPEVLPEAISYFRYYFAGVLAVVLYNACKSIMNALGDSKRPLYYLLLSSATNVALDILFIGGFQCFLQGFHPSSNRCFRFNLSHSITSSLLDVNPDIFPLILILHPLGGCRLYYRKARPRRHFSGFQKVEPGGLAVMFHDSNRIAIIIKQALPAQACAMHSVMAVDT